MLKHALIGFGYKNILKPVLFQIDAEKVHNGVLGLGEFLGRYNITKSFINFLFNYRDPNLKKNILGLDFENPIGLGAGFDYNGNLAGIMNNVGFGFSTVGTVTAKPYKGNKPPRLARLPKSKSLLVNKGFKSDGADKVLKRLDAKNLSDTNIGISVGSSNIPEVNTITKAIDDYLYTFDKFKSREYAKYFELNISCPNTDMTESFSDPENFESLVKQVTGLDIVKPIFVKMPNEISNDEIDRLINISISYNIRGFIFSNLVKDKKNKYFVHSEINCFKDNKGNFSGKPTEDNSNKLIEYSRKKYGNNICIIGCGGVFNASDAEKKFELGADLVQLITGMIFEGPQTAGNINYGIAHR